MSLPSMHTRMRRRQSSARIFAERADTADPPKVNNEKTSPTTSRLAFEPLHCGEEILTADQPAPQDRDMFSEGRMMERHQRERSYETLAPSFDSSTCSDAATFSDHGLARALNAEFVVPNVENPIATVKDRKSAMYMENVEDRRRVLETELEEARVGFNRSGSLHNISIKDVLGNSRYLDDFNLLAQRTRAYNVFLQDLFELQDLPKMGRKELEFRYTYRKQKQERDYAEANTASVKQQTRDLENRIADLELEREDVDKQVATLLQKVADATSESSRSCKNIDQLMEDNAYYKHMLANSDRDLASTREDLDHQRRYTSQLAEELHEVNQQHGLAASAVQQLEADNSTLCEEVEGLRDRVSDLNNEVQELCDGREFAEEVRADQRQEIRMLKTELERLRYSGTTRRDSVVSGGSHDEES